MVRPSSALQFLGVVAVVACAALVALTALPHGRYARFAGAAAESAHYLRLRWIFERIHFDPTPIDVAFIGTSHTQSAIDSRIVEGELRKRSPDLHVVNFAVPHLGRDLHYLITRELLTSRTVRELVVEVQDYEPRAPHPAFQRVAGVDDLLRSPLVANTGYFENLVRLPRRELDLFLQEKTGRMPVAFVPENYEGPHWDDTERLHGFPLVRDRTSPARTLDAGAAVLRAEIGAKEAFARRFATTDGCSLVMRYNRLYLEALLALAREKRVHVTFLYLPFFHGPEEPIEAPFYRVFGETIVPRAALDDASSWLNVDHLNILGARRTSQWVGQTLPIHQNIDPAPPLSAPCY